MRVVVSDTSPIRYLVLIGEGDLLRRLYSRILIPQAVHAELQIPNTPDEVRAWVLAAAPWVDVIPASQNPSESLVTASLDAGERAAIALALDRKADLLLMDERAGVEEARRLGLTATGTLGILARGAERGLIDLPGALERLRRTNFRIRPEILEQLLQQDANRPKSAP